MVGSLGALGAGSYGGSYGGSYMGGRARGSSFLGGGHTELDAVAEVPASYRDRRGLGRHEVADEEDDYDEDEEEEEDRSHDDRDLGFGDLEEEASKAVPAASSAARAAAPPAIAAASPGIPAMDVSAAAMAVSVVDTAATSLSNQLAHQLSLGSATVPAPAATAVAVASPNDAAASAAAMTAGGAVASATGSSSGAWVPSWKRRLAAAGGGSPATGADSPASPPPTPVDAPPPSLDLERWGWGVWEEQGSRPRMEDAYVASLDITQLWQTQASVDPAAAADGHQAVGRRVYFGLFDGHFGRYAADFCKSRMHEIVVSHPRFAEDLGLAMQESFLRCDSEFLCLGEDAGEGRGRHHDAGSTALAVIIEDRRITVASIGDSKAVICRRGGVAMQISVDHSPVSEQARIEAAGGWVVVEQELVTLSKLVMMDLSDPFVRERATQKATRWSQTSRVNGELGVARAIGDADFKGKRMQQYPWCWPKGRSPDEVFTSDLVISMPDVRTIELRDEDDFLIMACDGLWDVLSPDEAVKLTVDQLKVDASPKAAAQRLVKMALKLGSSDNVTCIVVILPTARHRML
jgi:serine/threonine protein phosphatase PrpC